MTTSDLFEYYAAQRISPTHAGFVDEAQLAAYDHLRQTVFHRLYLPPALFAGRRMLEFGPDTGENALVFARWGARLTLAEPNPNAHGVIREYFRAFNLESSLESLRGEALLDFSCTSRFDIIDAEGFIYTIQPQLAWIRKCAECLGAGGFLIISYMERYGGFCELLLKALYRRLIDDGSHGTGVEAAKLLFLPKWNSIQHTRTIDSWFMDVIENPFVRLKYCLDPGELLRDAYAEGFRLYSSWPVYRDPLAMHWIKKPYRASEELQGAISFAESRQLSHLLGVPSPLSGSADVALRLDSLVGIADRLCDRPSMELCREAQEHLTALLKTVPALSDAERILRMFQDLFSLMAGNRLEPMIEFCRNDAAFFSSWGTPAHYAVFEYQPLSR